MSLPDIFYTIHTRRLWLWQTNVFCFVSVTSRTSCARQCLNHAPLFKYDWCNNAGGLVQVTQFAVLPYPSPAATLALVLLALMPCLIDLWQNPEPSSFLPAAVYASLCSFVFGYHVHEKAILMVTIPMALEAIESQPKAQHYFVLSSCGHVALMPLLFTEQEYLVKVQI